MTPATPDPPVPTTVAISPASATFRSIGDSVRMTATVTDQYGQAMADVAVVWNSSDAAVAAVSEGLVTAVGNGSATVTATAGSATTGAEVAVEQEVVEVSVSPPPTALAAFGDTVRLSAGAVDANGHAVEGTAFTWRSGDTLVARVDSAGLVTAAGNGNAAITALVGAVSGTVAVTVAQQPATVVVSPLADTLVVFGDPVLLSAEAFDENGNAVAGATFGWSSSDVSVATVDASGLVYGATEGTATISADAGSARGTAQITVSNPDRATLVAFYEATGGPNWVNSENWSTDAPLSEWYGVKTTAFGRVRWLDLRQNGLVGSIPAQLGTLSHLEVLRLGRNALTGLIPPELGNTSRLRYLDIGPNKLDGLIPPELGKLARLGALFLNGNALTGPIPSELGNLSSLRVLWLMDNKLTGPIPPELGKLKGLRNFHVNFNPDLQGEIPPAVLALSLESFWSYGTGLCVPRTRGGFYLSRYGWAGTACGETEPGFQIELAFDPDVPEHIREAMKSQAEYWMEILRDTEAPDLFGGVACGSRSGDLVDDLVVTVRLGKPGERSRAGICGLTDLLRRRIPYFGAVRIRGNTDPLWLELIARHELGHVLGLGLLWSVREQVGNESTEEDVRDTYVVSPLATRAFDAAGGASYTGPKVPLHQYGSGGRNGHWRTNVFGSELMSWGWDDGVPTSAVTLQALADLGYTVDLSLADPYRLQGAAAAAARGAGAPPPFELGWEAPPSVVVCRSRARRVNEPEGLLSDSRRAGLGSGALRVDSVDTRATPRYDCEDLMWR